MRVRKWAWSGMAAAILPLAAQSQPVALGAGYGYPTPVDIAPGQVITLYVKVPGKTASDSVTAQPPLPVMFGGFSVLLRQSFPSDPISVPIQAVSDYQSCSAVAPPKCEVVSMVTVQIPYQLTPNIPRSRAPANFARLDISYQGNPATTLTLNPVTDRIHIVNGCDVIANRPEVNCVPLVTHADGTAVSIEKPAKQGETLSMSVVGLGIPDQIVASGAPSPDPGIAVSDVVLALDARANAAPSLPVPETASAPDESELLPGAAGIYRVRFTVPALPPGTPACGDSVRSNLAVSVGRLSSFDGASICVDVPGAQ